MISVKQIQQYPLFFGLSDEALENLSNILTKHTFAKNAYIYYPGNTVLNLYLVESGMVRLFMINSKGVEFLLNLARPRTVFGLPGLLSQEVRPAGAAALQTTIVLTMSRADLFHFVDTYPQFTRNLLIEMSSNLRTLLEHTQALASLSLNGRLAALILNMVKNWETPADKLELELPLTQTDLASWVGASRGRVNRELNKMQQLGLIKVEGTMLKITDLPGLGNLSKS